MYISKAYNINAANHFFKKAAIEQMIQRAPQISKLNLPSNKSLPYNTAFYITDSTVPVSWYTVEAGSKDTIYFRINGANYAPSLCGLPEGN